MRFVYKSARIALAAIFFAACASTAHYVKIDEALQARDFDKVDQIIKAEKQSGYTEKERVLYYLDSGMAGHYLGNYKASNQSLDRAEIGIEELYTKSISREIGSYLFNDNMLDYGGEDYEDVYLNIFKALNYTFLDQTDSALVEIRRVNQKLARLNDKYGALLGRINEENEHGATYTITENRFHNDALAAYLSAVFYRFDDAVDDARVEVENFHKAYRSQSHLYPFSPPPPPSLMNEGAKVFLNLLAFTGLSPRKKSERIDLVTDENTILVAFSSLDKDYARRFLSQTTIFFPGVKAGRFIGAEFPVIERRKSLIDRVVVRIDGKEVPAHLIEDMGRVAEETFRLKQAIIMARTVGRVVGKFIASEIARTAATELSGDSFTGELVGLLSSVGATVTESADLRVSYLFPEKAYVSELALEAGVYDIEVVYYQGDQEIYSDFFPAYRVDLDKLNLIESFFLK